MSEQKYHHRHEYEKQTMWVVLLTAMVWDIPFIDTIAAIVSSLVIIRWSIELLKDSGKALLDMEHGHHHHSAGLVGLKIEIVKNNSLTKPLIIDRQ